MKIANLAIGDRSFYLHPDEADIVLAAVRVARERGEWVSIADAGGQTVQLLIPASALLVFTEYEVDDRDPDGSVEANPVWIEFDL